MGTIQVRVDDDLKAKSDRLFKELGTDTTSAIRMFLMQALAYGGFPFEIRTATSANPFEPLTENQIMQKLEQARSHADEGMVKPWDEVVSDMRKKYEL